MKFVLIWQAPIVFFQKWWISLFSIVMIKLQVRVLRLTKLHDCFNVPHFIICTPCIIWFRHCISGIFGLWTFRKYILLCVSNVHNKEFAPLKQNRCIFSFWCETIFLTYMWLVAFFNFASCKPLKSSFAKLLISNIHQTYLTTVKQNEQEHLKPKPTWCSFDPGGTLRFTSDPFFIWKLV